MMMVVVVMMKDNEDDDNERGFEHRYVAEWISDAIRVDVRFKFAHSVIIVSIVSQVSSGVQADLESISDLDMLRLLKTEPYRRGITP